jgi:hypothetical protein
MCLVPVLSGYESHESDRDVAGVVPRGREQEIGNRKLEIGDRNQGSGIRDQGNGMW